LNGQHPTGVTEARIQSIKLIKPISKIETGRSKLEDQNLKSKSP